MKRPPIIPRGTLVRYTGHSILGGVQHGETYQVSCPNDDDENAVIGLWLEAEQKTHMIDETDVEVLSKKPQLRGHEMVDLLFSG